MAKKGKGTGHLPGMEPVKNPKIHAQAVKYAKIRDERMKLNKEEVKERQKLEVMMGDASIKLYEYDDVRCEIVSNDPKAKVVIGGAKDDEDDEGDDE